jgi:hypothetical protein
MTSPVRQLSRQVQLLQPRGGVAQASGYWRPPLVPFLPPIEPLALCELRVEPASGVGVSGDETTGRAASRSRRDDDHERPLSDRT